MVSQTNLQIFFTITSSRYGSVDVLGNRFVEMLIRWPLLLYNFKMSFGFASAAARNVSNNFEFKSWLKNVNNTMKRKKFDEI